MAETEACCNRTKRTTKKRKKKRVNFAADAKEKGELDSEIDASPKKDTKKAKRKFLFLSTLLGLLGYGRDRAAKSHATSSPDGGRGQWMPCWLAPDFHSNLLISHSKVLGGRFV